MNKNKKGLSDVVTTVLIILLVLAAVSIIATFLFNNFLNKGVQQISGDCTSLVLTPTACNSVGSAPITDWNVLVKHTAGDADINSIKLIYANDDGVTLGTKTETNQANLPGIGETESINTAGGDLGSGLVDVTSVKVSAEITTSAGSVLQCPETATVTCA